jgi:putative PIN family toxin of toxin-antitoxin system
MKTVIEPNVLASALSSRSGYHWLIELLLDEVIELYVTGEILLEYEEILKKKYSESAASNLLVALRELPNVHDVKVYFRWDLLNDPKDNNLVDCYLAAGAHYLITHDAHFPVLRSIDLPKVNTLRIEEFKAALEDAEWT